MYHAQISVLLLVVAMAATAVGVSGCGSDGTIVTVKDWIVGFATETGEFIREKATAFAGALARAWGAFWGPQLVSGVLVDEKDPLRGIYQYVLKCEVEWGSSGSRDRSNRLSIELSRPRMVRDSIDDDQWRLADEERQRIEELRDLLLDPQ